MPKLPRLTSRFIRAASTPEVDAPSPASLIPASPIPAAPARDSLTPSAWTPLWASVPALLLGAAVLARGTAPTPLSLPSVTQQPNAALPGALDTPPVLPASQTLILAPQSAGEAGWLRGRMVPASFVAVRAPVGGQVARLWVGPGQPVRRGQVVMTISSGPSSRPSPRAERAQNRAESEQVAAASQQDALNVRLMAARERMAKAEQRVTQAQARVAQARAIVARVRSQPDAVTATEPQPTTAPAASAADRALIAASQTASANAERAALQAEAAEKEALSAETAARQKTQAIAEAKKTSDAVQAAFEEKQAKGSDVEAARAALEDAQTAAAEASTKAHTARLNADRLNGIASTRRAQAKDAAAQATEALQRLSAAPRVASPPRPAQRPVSRGTITFEQAAKMARSALDESDEAVAEARRLKRATDAYERQVKSTANRIDNSSEQLEQAQNRVLSSAVPPVQTRVYAPSGGVVTDVARLTREVSSGEVVATLGQGGAARVRFADNSGLWRLLRPGMLLPAVLPAAANIPAAPATQSQAATPQLPVARPSSQRRAVAPNAAPVLPAPHAGRPAVVLPAMPPANVTGTMARPAKGAPTASTTAGGRGTAIVLRVREVVPPKGNKVAFIFASIEGAAAVGSSASSPGPNAVVLGSVLRPGTKSVLRVPVSALWRKPDGQQFVAVLERSPQDDPGEQPTVPSDVTAPSAAAPATPGVAGQLGGAPGTDATGGAVAASKAAVLTGASGEMLASRVQWRPVVLGRSDSGWQEVASGLKAGERIVLNIDELRRDHGLTPDTSDARVLLATLL